MQKRIVKEGECRIRRKELSEKRMTRDEGKYEGIK